jgi:hypothetical protein
VLRQSSTTICVIVAACLGFAASGIIGWLGATSLPDGPLAQHDTQHDRCARPEPGSEISEPRELRSHDGVLELDLAIDDQKLPDGTTRYCYVTSDGKLSPTLRLKPGDQLVIRLKTISSTMARRRRRSIRPARHRLAPHRSAPRRKTPTLAWVAR